MTKTVTPLFAAAAAKRGSMAAHTMGSAVAARIQGRNQYGSATAWQAMRASPQVPRAGVIVCNSACVSDAIVIAGAAEQDGEHASQSSECGSPGMTNGARNAESC